MFLVYFTSKMMAYQLEHRHFNSNHWFFYSIFNYVDLYVGTCDK